MFVTLEALWTLDSLSVRDVPAAMVICDEQSGRIHLAASRKFDYAGAGPDLEHEGRPVIVLTTHELDQLLRQ